MQEELKAFGRALPYKGFFFVSFLCWVALFHFLGTPTFGYVETPSVFGWLNWVYNVNPDDSIGYLVPPLVLGLFWWKRHALMAIRKEVWWPALTLVVLGLLFHALGYMIQLERLSVIGFFVGLYGLMGLYWGWSWLKNSFFPFFLFAFCIPVTSLLTEFTLPLRLLVTEGSVGLADIVFGINVVHEGTRIFEVSGGFKYDVAPACSGIRSLIVMTGLTTIYGFMVFKSWWKRALMIATALPLTILQNLIRITGTIIVAEAFGQDVGDQFEGWAGFFTFAVALICVMLLGRWLQEEKDAEGYLTQQPI